MDRLTEFWSQLNLQQQISYLIIGAGLIASLVLVLVNANLSSHIGQLEQQNTRLEKDIQSLQQQAASLKQPRKANRPRKSSLLSHVNQVFKTQGISESVKKVQPENDNKLEVNIEQASFDQLMKTLVTLESQNIYCTRLILQQSQQAGKVSGRFNLHSTE